MDEQAARLTSFRACGGALTPEQTGLLERLLATLTPDQLLWLSGFLAGVYRGTGASVSGEPASPAPTAAPDPSAAAAPEVTLLYGSQTGNAAWLAAEHAGRLKRQGIRAARRCMSEYPAGELARAKNLLVLISTHGEGDPPDAASALWQLIFSERAPQLPELRYSVLALGDITYDEHFCTAGRRIDERLEELGATRLFPRADCDVDFEEPAEEWFGGVTRALLGQRGAAPGQPAPAHVPDAPAPADTTAAAAPSPAARRAARPSYSRKNPFPAEVLENRDLNGPGAVRETRHLSLSLTGSGLKFEPGDSMGVYPTNHPRLVDELLEELGYSGEEPVAAGGERCSLRDALTEHCEITVLSRPLVEHVAGFAEHPLSEVLAGRQCDGPADYMKGRDLLDVLRDVRPEHIPAQELVSALRRLPARLYSIASSQKAHPDEAHLTITAVRYQAHGRDRYGVCSVQCAERVRPGERLPIYVNSNPYFRMPPDPDTPIIMIGPGAGVAPFRAFLEEREAAGAKGRTWLFFGARHARSDFLYQADWQRWQQSGVLTRMDVAFSRDTPQKVYVQHRMCEHAKDLFAWLEEGAYFYVCGDERRMAPDVHRTLLEIVEQQGSLARAQAEAYVADLQRERRYQRDVY